MMAFIRDVTLRVIVITILSLILPVLAYQSIHITIVRFFVVCLLSVISTIGLGYMLGFNKTDREHLRTKVVNIVRTKILKK